MEEINALLGECSARFRETEDYRILKTYRTRDNRLSFDERFSIAKSLERAYAPFYDLLRADAPTLTDSDLMFCALSVQKIETVAIAECLTVTKDAIRMRKLRIREKLPQKWFELIFPEQKRNSSESVTSQNSEAPDTDIPWRHQQTKNAMDMKETMSFSKAVSSAFSKLFTFEGRARRSEYWYFWLFMVILKTAVYIIGIFYTVFSDPTSFHMDSTVISPTFETIFMLVFFPLGLSVNVRRLHDIDCSGWMVLLLSVLPLALDLLHTWYWPSALEILRNSDVTPSIIAGVSRTAGLVLLLSLGLLIFKVVLFCRPGTEGPNTYGPDPIKIIPNTNE